MANSRMNTPAHYVALLIALIAAASACQRRMPPQKSSASVDWWASTNSPAIALWDGGITMLRKPPFLICGVWADGMIVRSVDGRLKRGQVSPQEMRKLMNEVEAAGFFSPPLAYGATRPDGPVRRLPS